MTKAQNDINLPPSLQQHIARTAAKLCQNMFVCFWPDFVRNLTPIIAITFCSGSTLNFQLFPPKVCIQLATALAALFADNQDLCWSFVSQIHISL